MKAAKKVESTPSELVSRNQSLLAIYSSQIEGSADRIIAESPSRVARRRALIWKAEAIPIMQTSLLNVDPVAAVLDTWAFIFQMSDYMDRPELKQELGEFHPVVTETLKNMDGEMERLVLTVAPTAKVQDFRERVKMWANNHPVQSSLAGRPSADPELIRRVGEADLGAVASIKALGESLGGLTARLDSYNAYLPKQARWQAELLLVDVTHDPQVSAALSNAAVFSNTLAKTSGAIDRMPDFMSQTRTALKGDVEEQRLAVQEFLRGERLETLADLQQERIATVAALHGERVAATADFHGETQSVLDALHRERIEALNDFNRVSEKAVNDFDQKGRGLIDHFFVRALELLLLTLVLCSVVAWLLLRRYAPRRPDRGERLYDRAA